MTTILLILLLYVVPVIVVYFWISAAFYHPNGIFRNITPGSLDLCLMLLPGVNLVGIFMCWIAYYPIIKEVKYSNKIPFIQRFFSYPFKNKT